MERKLTCIVCPVGCSLTAEIENGEVIKVTGNTCPRGKVYAQDECINPKRTVTTTVKTVCGELVPAKTDSPVPKEKVFEVMEIINKTRIKLPISVGDVIIKDVFGANVVATKNVGDVYE